MYKGQKDRVLNMLKSHKYVTVPQLMRSGVANYTGRISDLREEGFKIENERWFDKKKRCICSRYKLRG